jgi:hypothetical protein
MRLARWAPQPEDGRTAPGRTQGKIGFHGGNVAVERTRVRDLEGQKLVLPGRDRAVAEGWLGWHPHQ